MSRTGRLAVMAAALSGVGCGETGLLDETEGPQESSEPTATVEQAATGCQTICFKGPCAQCPPTCQRICPPTPPPPQQQTGTVVPEFYITHVVYAPPGRSSSIEYSNSSSVGSTTSTAKGFKTEGKITAEASASTPLGGGMGVKLEAGASGSRTKTDALDVSVKYSQGYRMPGQVDHIDHNYDQIWFLIRPKIDFTFKKGATAAQDELRWKFGAQSESNGIPYWVYSGELNNAMQMPQNVRDTLDYYGITPDKYPTLLAANPLFTGTTPNMTMNPERYRFIGVYPYRPPRTAEDQPAVQPFSIERSMMQTTTREYDFDYFVGLTVWGEVNAGVVKAKLSVEGKWTWTSSSSFSDTIGNGSIDTFTVGQPAFGYSGPTLLRVYQDLIYNTYAFTLDYPQGETNLALHRPSYQSSDLPGYGAVAARANDGNQSGNFWDGSVTHTDWGYMGTVPEAPGQWWYVDLGAEKVVTAVKIWNRTDCCSERLSPYKILAVDWNEGRWKVISDHSGDNTAGVAFFHHPVEMVRTRYVMVAKANEDYLHLAEVEVLGY